MWWRFSSTSAMRSASSITFGQVWRRGHHQMPYGLLIAGEPGRLG